MKTNFEKWHLFILAWFIGLVLYLFVTRKTSSKEDIAKFYNISKPTLSKWITFFHPSISPLQWKKMRNLTENDVKLIKESFGDNPSFVLSKGQLCERTASDYKILATSIKKKLPKIGISEEAWTKSSVFPPIISQKIIDLMGDIGHNEFEIQNNEI